MVTTATGKKAELAVCDYLKNQGFSILDLNWKTKVCEIDVIARKKKIIYFVEVKYRGSSSQGTGLEHIGPHKVNRLKFAASLWAQISNWADDYRILGAEVSGHEYENIRLVEID